MTSFGGCSTTDLKLTRAHYASQKSQDKAQQIANERSQQIIESETFYGNKLVCLSNAYNDFFKAAQQAAISNPEVLGGHERFRMAVAPIRDKTGKIFDLNSTVLSDMVIDSMARFKHFDILETPLAPDSLIESRNNFLDPRYKMPPGIVQNFASTMTSLQHLPIGTVFPSNYYISGAIIQYDENQSLPTKRNIGVDISQYQGKREVDTITVGITLRLVDSWTGSVARVSDTADLASISLTNTFYTIKTSHNFFRLIGTKDYGIDYSVEVGDPKTAAVKEIIDKAVYKLLEKFLKPYQVYKYNCEEPEYVRITQPK
ncbi:MAG: CsgG/HfaB family protein [Cardiobacteriaceae bacterium]|nr:CsgG/HfaB family protein [Cardiobacteriaceae bacterium]